MRRAMQRGSVDLAHRSPLVPLSTTEQVAPGIFRVPALEALGSSAVFGNVLLVAVLNELQYTLAPMAILVLLRLLLRRTWIALAAIVAIALPVHAGSTSAIDLVVAVAIPLLGVTVLLRLGVLAHGVMYVVFGLVTSLPLTLDGDVWYFGRSLIVLLLIGALATSGFVVALGGRPAFGVMEAR
jgi:hypothetical protein